MRCTLSKTVFVRIIKLMAAAHGGPSSSARAVGHGTSSEWCAVPCAWIVSSYTMFHGVHGARADACIPIPRSPPYTAAVVLLARLLLLVLLLLPSSAAGSKARNSGEQARSGDREVAVEADE